jgi:hypothetical protein
MRFFGSAQQQIAPIFGQYEEQTHSNQSTYSAAVVMPSTYGDTTVVASQCRCDATTFVPVSERYSTRRTRTLRRTVYPFRISSYYELPGRQTYSATTPTVPIYRTARRSLSCIQSHAERRNGRQRSHLLGKLLSGIPARLIDNASWNSCAESTVQFVVDGRTKSHALDLGPP